MKGGEPELDAVVIGAGWAGIGVSHAMVRAGLRHRVLERARICETWRSQRWDSFRMNTPNVLTVMPGDRYEGDDPEGFMTRDAFVTMVEEFALRHALPVETGTEVREVRAEGDGFAVQTPQGPLRARNVVVATGNLNTPRRPAAAADLPATVTQIDASAYRSAAGLPPGAVLVVGCGNTGGQIAEDLARAGRRVCLSTGRNGRIPRRYRGRDIILWLIETGRMARPRTTATGRPLLGATHTISLQSLSAMGVTLLGRFEGVDADGRPTFADDLADSAAFGDRVSAEIRAEIDAHIARENLPAPAAAPDPAETCPPRFPDPPIRRLDLPAAGIGTVIWSTGFTGVFGWLHVPGATDGRGQPVQTRGISVPGITFAGLDTSESLAAGTVLVMAEESDRIARHIRARA
jgi:putative flavoprotein involved in K+ transport